MPPADLSGPDLLTLIMELFSSPLLLPSPKVAQAKKMCVYCHMLKNFRVAGPSILRFWGRYRAPFPMARSVLFPQFTTLNFPKLYSPKSQDCLCVTVTSMKYIYKLLHSNTNNLINMHKNVKLMKKAFSTMWGFFPIYPPMSIKFPIPRAPGPVPKKAVTALGRSEIIIFNYPHATRCGGDIVTLLWFRVCVCASVRPSVRPWTLWTR